MNRRTFLSRLLVGLIAAPVIAKVISEPRPPPVYSFGPSQVAYFDGVDDYMKTAPFPANGLLPSGRKRQLRQRSLLASR